MAMLYELDNIEKRVLLGAVLDRARADLNNGQPLTEMKQVQGDIWCGNPECVFCEKRGLIPTAFVAPSRPGERVQKFWCEGCRKWHEASLLGGVAGGAHGTEK